MLTGARRVAILVGVASALSAPRLMAQTTPAVPAPLMLAQPEAQNGPPPVITLQDALERARKADATFLSASTDAVIAREDRVQARAALLPSFSHTTQYLGTQDDTPLATGRFVSNDGVNMYRSWMVAHGEVTAGTLSRTPLKRAQAAEALTEAKLEIARRGLVVTVTGRYYALVTAEHKYATAQQAAAQAQRFLDIAQRQQNLGQVARSDVVKADIAFQQQQQAFAEATLQVAATRLALAVLLFPTLNENFTVVDDLTASALPPFPEIRSMAERDNPDLRVANQTLKVAQQEVAGARQAFLPTVTVDLDYGIEANEFALHSVAVAAPELGVLPNLGYFVTVNLSVPIWDWGGMRSKLHQSRARETQAQSALSQAQRQLVANLYGFYNEAAAARAAVDSAQRVAELATESLRLINLRYEAGESSALEVVDAQNTLVQARDSYDSALSRFRVAVAQLQTVTGPF